MAKKKGGEYVPMFSTRLVREKTVAYSGSIESPQQMYQFLRTYFSDKDREEFIVVLLTSNNTVIGIHQAHVGGLASCIVEPSQVFKAAVLANAGCIILAHNHPSDNCEPSREDIATTRRLVEGGKMMGIPVHDHLIVTQENGYTSLAERGLISN